MPHKLLLADDSITIQKVVGIIFSNEEYELTVTDNGDTALERAREIVPDVVLADALMPGRNGYDLCREIRRDPRLRHIPTLLMTGVFEAFDENRARECGADDFITKPFESQQLIEKVRTLIQSAPLRKTEPAPSAIPAAPVPPAAASVEVPASSASPQQRVQPAAQVQPPPATFTFEDASPEDDLWGAIEVDDDTDEEVFFGEAVEDEAEEEPADYFAEDAADDVAFGEEIEEEYVASEVAEEEDFFAFEEDGVAPPVQAALPEEEDPFGDIDLTEAYRDESVSASPSPLSLPEADPFAEDAFTPEPAMEEGFVFEEEPVAQVPAPKFADDVDPFGAATQSPAERPVEVPGQVAPVPAGEPLLITEEQIAAAVARISREVIEKIAWEVVPDLAESLIRAEIRKIREGA